MKYAIKYKLNGYVYRSNGKAEWTCDVAKAPKFNSVADALQEHVRLQREFSFGGGADIVRVEEIPGVTKTVQRTFGQPVTADTDSTVYAFRGTSSRRLYCIRRGLMPRWETPENPVTKFQTVADAIFAISNTLGDVDFVELVAIDTLKTTPPTYKVTPLE